MALFRSNLNLLKCSSRLSFTPVGIQSAACRSLDNGKSKLLQPIIIHDVQVRGKGSALTNYTGRELWTSVYGVSPTGRKRGRGRILSLGAKMDLNFGKKLGDGKANLLYPGLNERMVAEAGVVQNKIRDKPPSEEEIIQRKPTKAPRSTKYRAPLARGWTSTTMMGTKMEPLKTDEQNLDGFVSYVVLTKNVSRMTATLGNKRSCVAVVVVGNQNGLVGMGIGKSLSMRSAMMSAQKRAYNRLVAVPRFEDHTVYHNMYSQFHKTKLYIYKKSKGYGCVAHRVIICICKAAGIENIYVKTEGAKNNNLNVSRAFISALAHQETHQQLSNRLKLHVVEYRHENNFQPVVIASPEGEDGKASGEQLANDEEDIYNDFARYYFRGQLKYRNELYPTRLKHQMQNWNRARKMKQKELYMMRNQDKSLQMRKANLWGDIHFEKPSEIRRSKPEEES